ncbi:glycine/D-amino acid oxidase-like deaminating enzyme [Mariniflexile fucanivorans]|uniref:Glycine/D-amino acid oxidase-like deaminating enzyme n=1 Tax=Mariniflexile fucanivorans TaxID=264023 RepID=A0A4R1RH80_9FLAO|nr:FAD-binding oxidoreductase [Mariniflexile fucanivorans]TCL65418.1 glycine/D-amino acid oxidase-like deaminating enzyme [Mariniflexile fucanivorans]
MKQVDYIIVGIGLAGISFCEQLRANNKQFVVFDNASQQSSTVAGGLYNPVVLKRFTPVWKCQEQLDLALPMYANLEGLLQVKLDYKMPVYRKFASLEEQNDWFTASDKAILSEYLSPKIIKNNNSFIDASFGYGEVLETGRIDVKTLIEAYKAFLLQKDLFIESVFNYDDLVLETDIIQYKNIQAKHIVFAEGFGVKQNPFFKDLPLVPAKGELLTIHAPNLKIDFVLKAGVFLIPLGDDLYIVGATYEWKDLSAEVTVVAKEELETKLKQLVSCDFEIVKQVAGIRPTVKDRRPLVGNHTIHKNMYVLNGLGTRGVMIGPYVAQQLYDFIEKNEPLENEIDIARFYS